MAGLFTPTILKLLTVLLENPLQEFKEIELITAANIGKGAGAQHILELINAGILSEQRVGKAKVISVNLKSPQFFFLKNILDRQKIKRMSPSRLAAVFFFKKEAQPHFSLLILFGSTVAGTATAKSDIDLLVVAKDFTAIESARSKTEELFGEKLNIHGYTAEEISSGLKEESFLQQVLFKGVILGGYDLAYALFRDVAKNEKKDFSRLLYFKERVAAARRNYEKKDVKAAEEIMSNIHEQLTFYILTENKIPYQSKKDAAHAIAGMPVGKVITKINKAALDKKIDKLGAFLQEKLAEAIIKEEYGL